MKTTDLKQELHALIEKADTGVLELAYSILRAPGSELKLSSAQIGELERRYAAHLANPSEGSSWEEVRSRISSRSK